MNAIQEVRNAVNEKIKDVLEVEEVTSTDFLGQKVTVIPAGNCLVVQAFGETFGRLEKAEVTRQVQSAAWLWVKERYSPEEAMEVLGK